MLNRRTWPRRLARRGAPLAFLACLALLRAVPAQTVDDGFVPPDPRDLVIYQVITDRFDDGDPGNNTASPRGNFNPGSSSSIHGGDFKGIERRLDYIAALGANAIWISPFLENTGGQYHGYSTYDWFWVDPHFGSEDELRDLIRAAHARGIAVHFDLIANHAGNLINDNGSYQAPPGEYNLSWRNNGFTYPPPFDSLAHYHAHGNINNFSQPEEVLGELVGLDDLKTETQFVRDEMASIWGDWMERTGVDGFRVDTVKHVDLGFWQDFTPKLRTKAAELGKQNFFVYGEVFSGDDGFCRRYVGVLGGGAYAMDGVLDFQQHSTGNGVFASASQPTSNLTGRMNSKVSNYGANFDRIPTWLDSHDQRRFLNVVGGGVPEAEAWARLKLAATYQFCVYGPPILYYGTEQGFNGGGDPNNREDMFDGSFEQGPSLGDNFDFDHELYRYYQILGRARGAYAPLRRGSTTVYAQDSNGPGVYAFGRRFGGAEVFVALNTDNAADSLPAIGASFNQGTILVDLLDAQAAPIVVGLNGAVGPMTLAGYQAMILVPQADALPAAPRVVSASIANGATVAVDATISFEFDAPMDRDSVESAFFFGVADGSAAVVAATWNEESTMVEFAPAAPLRGAAKHVAAISALALGANGAPLGNPPRVEFATERADRTAVVPASVGTSFQLGAALTIDGDGSDWPVASPLPAANSARVDNASVLAYVDASGDAAGDGDYSHPTNGAFSRQDADLAEFRFAHDADNFYFYFRPVRVNPDASFFTPYFGVVGRVEGWGTDSLVAPGIAVSNNATGVAEIDLSLLPGDFEAVFAGQQGPAWRLQNVAQADPAGQFNAATGEVEIAAPIPADMPESFDLILFPYTGLETFGGMREVMANNGNFDPGGSNAGANAPDVFDLAGASPGDQAADLSDYAGGGVHTRPVRSFLRVQVVRRAPPQGAESTEWAIY